MSEVHPNVQLMRDVYAAFAVGDVETAASYWTKDATHHYPGRSIMAGSHAGLDNALAFAGRMFELTEGRLTMEVLDIAGSDEYVYARVFTTYAMGDKKLDMPFINIMRVENGKVAEFWTYPHDQYAVDEFWGYAS